MNDIPLTDFVHIGLLLPVDDIPLTGLFVNIVLLDFSVCEFAPVAPFILTSLILYCRTAFPLDEMPVTVASSSLDFNFALGSISSEEDFLSFVKNGCFLLFALPATAVSFTFAPLVGGDVLRDMFSTSSKTDLTRLY